MAAAVEFGPRLSDSHVVFVVDNESDVHVINRLRSRESRAGGAPAAALHAGAKLRGIAEDFP